MWGCINNLDQISDWLKIRSRCGMLIYSAWQRLTNKTSIPVGLFVQSLKGRKRKGELVDKRKDKYWMREIANERTKTEEILTCPFPHLLQLLKASTTSIPHKTSYHYAGQPDYKPVFKTNVKLRWNSKQGPRRGFKGNRDACWICSQSRPCLSTFIFGY